MKYRMKYRVLVPIIILVVVIILSILARVRSTKEDYNVIVKNTLNHVKYLSSDTEFKGLQYRVAGYDGEKKAAKYIEEAFKSSGLNVEKQTFDFDEVVSENSNTVELFYKNGEKINVTSSKIISSKNVDITLQGNLVDLGKGTKEDFELKKDQIQGKFILIKADSSTSADYFSSMEFSKGVKGAIVCDPSFEPSTEPIIANKFIMENSNVYGENLMTVTTIVQEDYDKLVTELEGKQEIDMSEYIKYDIKKEKKSSQNIVATKNSEKNLSDKPLIIIGAHYDCVNVPGALDNAAGVASLIELARALSSNKLNYDIKFVAFGAEEVGLWGSNYFVSNLSKEDLNRCKLMINIDGPGSGDVFIIGKSTGESDDILARKLAFQTAEKK
ncbi:MAG: M20/M25/M40 family metallo-hydrolase [Clostridiaceae bacterium]|nr:M20/M25/M40 family metallo-hydrolase [Clostridiaceae bacterium]